MATDIKKTNVEDLSYLDIVRGEGDIKIPLIQRDYAQGRPGKKVKNIRDKFVKDLYNSIINKKRLNLDFVYGASDGKRFIPLDGQQRLTTLFLIHLYLDGLRGKQDEQLKFKFSYETRDSSRIFCEKIIDNRFDLFSLASLGPRKDTKGKIKRLTPSEIIRDQNWWLHKWNADPTIDGILRMLDTIDTIFYENWKTAAANLFSKENKTIQFQFLRLEDFYDPDDLFIKMNARGLPLTEFEIFKGKWMEQIENTYSSERVKEMKSLIDVSWTDFLWPMRRLRKGLKNIDPYFQNLLKFVIGNAVASISSKGVNFDVLFEANKKELTFSYGKYTEDYSVNFDKAMLDRITEELTTICSEHSIFTRFKNGKCESEEWLDLDKEWDFFVIKDRDNNEPNYKGRTIVYALSRFSYLIPTANDSEVNEWTRLICNLLENTRIDNSGDEVKVLKDIDGMLGKLTSFYKDNQESSRVNCWVAQSGYDPNGFSRSQWQEEKIKSELRKDPEWNAEITEAERHSYLKGKIGLILWCCGEIGDHIPFNQKNLKKDIEVFRSYKKKCLRLFDEAGKNDSEVTTKFLLVRAMLSKGDYMPWLSANRVNLYNNPGHRDYSWRALFGISNSNHVEALRVLKQVIDDANFNSNDVIGSLKTIIKKRRRSAIPLWRRLLTSSYATAILRNSRQGFIAFADGTVDNVLIYGSSRRSGYHAELMTLYIERLIKKYRKDVSVSVSWNMGTEADYSITINNQTFIYWDAKWYYNQIIITSFTDLVTFIRKAIDGSATNII